MNSKVWGFPRPAPDLHGKPIESGQIDHGECEDDEI